MVYLYDLDGAVLSPPTVTTCVNGYPDSTNTKCIPCGPDMTFDPTLLICKCTLPSYALNGACYTSTTGILAQNFPTPTNKTTVEDYLA